MNAQTCPNCKTQLDITEVKMTISYHRPPRINNPKIRKIAYVKDVHCTKCDYRFTYPIFTGGVDSCYVKVVRDVMIEVVTTLKAWEQSPQFILKGKHA